jgi:(p)ppGpp synthase/HD superfamily hydrolase
MLSERFTAAVDYVRIAHAGQTRKGTAIPYIQHLLAVASLVLEHGGDEDQAIAGLLHDVVEDCGESHAGVVGERFGERVLAIVLGCTDGTAEAKAGFDDDVSRRRDWLRRKQAYLNHLAHASDDMLLVSGCDKLHNARAIVGDLERPEVGQGVFARFTGGRDGTLTYCRLLADLFTQRGAAMAGALEREVERMYALAGEQHRAA